MKLKYLEVKRPGTYLQAVQKKKPVKKQMWQNDNIWGI